MFWSLITAKRVRSLTRSLFPDLTSHTPTLWPAWRFGYNTDEGTIQPAEFVLPHPYALPLAVPIPSRLFLQFWFAWNGTHISVWSPPTAP
jgi:hypothetical protein